MDSREALVAAVGVAAGSGGGAALTLWWVKLSLKRVLDQYDDAHRRHEDKLSKFVERVSDVMTDIKTKLAVMEVRAAEIEVIKNSFDKNTREVVALGVRLQKVQQDVGIAHQRIRMMVGG